VFGWYLILAIGVTAIQLVLEYRETREIIRTELGSQGHSFERSASDALWTFDREMIDVLTQGMVRSGTITGSKIENESGEVIARAGDAPDGEYALKDALLAPYQYEQFPLVITTPRGERKAIGKLVLFSSRSVILKRVQYSFLIILINSLVKTAGLWLIFHLVVSRLLSRPLSRMTEVITNMEFASNSPNQISLDYPYDDELGHLINSMRQLQLRLSKTRAELDDVNLNLENTVLERTRHLTDVTSFNQKIILHSPLPIVVLAADGRCVEVNEAYAQMVSKLRDELLSQNFFSNSFWHDVRLAEFCGTASKSNSPVHREAMMANARGEERWIEWSVLPITLLGDLHFLVQGVDLTERKCHEEELSVLAFNDALTKLPNRRLLLERLKQALSVSKRLNSHGAVLFLDLNKFKQLNDTHGHEVGDQLLVEVARRLNEITRDTDTVARLGGDEFVVLLEGLGPEATKAENYAKQAAEKIRQSLSEEYVLGEIRHRGSASTGITLFLGDEADPDQIIKDADAAMYEAKRGKPR